MTIQEEINNLRREHFEGKQKLKDDFDKKLSQIVISNKMTGKEILQYVWGWNMDVEKFMQELLKEDLELIEAQKNLHKLIIKNNEANEK